MGRRKSGKKSSGRKSPANLAAAGSGAAASATIGAVNETAGPGEAAAGERRQEQKSGSKIGPKAARTEKDAETGARVQNIRPKKKSDAQKPDARGRRPNGRRGIGAAVFLPCLFLTLLLGLYLGTLLPEMRQEVAVGTASPAAEPPKSETPQIAPPKSNAPDGRIASLVSRTDIAPEDAAAWTELGNAYFDTGKPRDAIAAYRRALALKPDNADVMTDMGIMYRELGDFTQAVDCFRRAREMDPRHANALFNEGVVQLNDLKNPAEARKAWEALLRQNPEARSPDGKRVDDILRLLPQD